MKKVLSVHKKVTPHWVGDGFHVQSIFSYQSLGAAISPFLLLDYGSPKEFTPTKERRGVGEHPHRGFETVTIVYQGEVEHRDSKGNAGKIGPGDVQWMTAASGLVHEEKHSTGFAAKGGTMEMVQLWVNLPKKDKMTEPRYQDLAAADIHDVALSAKGSTARVIAGEHLGVKGPAKTFTPLNLWDLKLKAEDDVTLPVVEGHTAAIFVVRGGLALDGGLAAKAGEMVLFDQQGAGLQLKAAGDTVALLLSGEPIDEPVVGYGPFVMNTEAEIRQAVADYQQGAMGRLEG